ncbi:MAG: glycosyl transferase [Pirellulaceae bacterium]|nr:MAG: glycosyl transferase [Pirellulaceae bacterium]
MEVSVVIPIYNERDNIRLLYQELVSVMDSTGKPYELVFVDDGSTDGSTEILEQLAGSDHRVRLLVLTRNFGQSAALQAGIDHARGELLVFLDGDLQNDPADIPGMLALLEEGYDLVHGWRRQRHDRWLTRRMPSWLANRLIGWMTGHVVHDLGCALKVMRRWVAQQLELYGDMHRFIAILAQQRGARLVEVETHHRARQFGRSKYGLSRTAGVLLDLGTVCFLRRYMAYPMRFFGWWALASWTVAAVSLVAVMVMKWGSSVDMTGNPLLLLSVLAVLLGVQFFSLGLLGEVASRIYYRSHVVRNYTLRPTRGEERAGGQGEDQPGRQAA